jgi:hypothetical protein
MTRLASLCRTAWTATQSLTVFAICIGTGLALPLGLAATGFQAV